MRRTLLAAVLGSAASACPADDAPPLGDPSPGTGDDGSPTGTDARDHPRPHTGYTIRV